jgi:hypothetical protein
MQHEMKFVQLQIPRHHMIIKNGSTEEMRDFEFRGRQFVHHTIPVLCEVPDICMVLPSHHTEALRG